MTPSPSTAHSAFVVSKHRPPWIHRTFLKDKLLTHERYWRPRSKGLEREASRSKSVSLTFRNAQSSDVNIIPDGKVWRRYLPFWRALAEDSSFDHREASNIRLVLLESAVELMDWRNTAPCLHDGSMVEKAAVQERSMLRKLLEAKQIAGYCDLSLRDHDGDDEFDLLQYSDMTVEMRAEQGLRRAGKLLSNDNAHHRPAPTATGALVVVSEDEFEKLSASDLERQEREEGFQTVPISKLTALLKARFGLSEPTITEFDRLLESSFEEYEHRNARPNDSTTERLTVTKNLPSAQLSEAQIQDGLRKHTLYRGRLEVTTQNVQEAFVQVTTDGPSGIQRYFVSKPHFGKAFHQDMVVIKPLPESEWGLPVGKRRLVHQTDIDTTGTAKKTDHDGVSGTATDRSTNSSSAVPSARVVSILEPSRRTFVATLVDTPGPDEKAVLLVPMDIRIPKIRIVTRTWQRFIQQRLLVRVDKWEADSTYPHGYCKEILGPVGEMETEVSLQEEWMVVGFCHQVVSFLVTGYLS